MTLQGRNLTEGITGADVADLQTELSQLSYPIPAVEQSGTSFGAGTLSAVQQFQTDQGLTSTGVVDSSTAAALSVAIRASKYTVTGIVTSSVNAGVGGLSVLLVDKNVGGDVNLATSFTNAAGVYSITVCLPPGALKSRHKTQPDLQVRVSSRQGFLGASKVRYNAPLNVTLDLSIPPGTVGLPSEYESLNASLSSFYPGRLGALKEGADRQDITFLANK
jgi:peptidoglycan hydrolase-like protein with peptidoglycan-binding domain